MTPEDAVVLRSEFGGVRVWVSSDANGDRLGVEHLRSGATAYVDPLELESLTYRGHEVFRHLVLPEMYDRTEHDLVDPAERGRPGDPRPAVAAALATACRVLDGEGLTEAYGHVSARLTPELVLVSKRLAPGQVRGPDDLVAVGLDGAPVEGGTPADVPPEIPLHLAVYRARPDVHAVCRSHPVHGLAASTVLDEVPATTGFGGYLGGPVPVHGEARLGRSAEAADAVARTLGDGLAVLVRGAGAITVGASVAQAVVRSWYLDRACRAVLLGAAVGDPRPLTTEEVEGFAGLPDVAEGQIDRVWDYCAGRHQRRTA